MIHNFLTSIYFNCNKLKLNDFVDGGSVDNS